LDTNFFKKIEDLFKNKQFESIKFEINSLDEDKKKHPYLYNILGIIEATNKKIDEARKYFYLALEINKYDLNSLINLSNLCYIDRDFQNIISLLKNYNLKYPENERIILILADLCFSAGFVRDTIYFHKRLIDCGKYDMKDLAALIFLLNYSSEYSEDEYKKYCKLYDDKLLENKIDYDILNNEHDKKKIGFLSYDLREHSVGYFLRDFIKNLNNKNYKTVAFNLFKGDMNNLFVSSLKNSFNEWHDVSDLNDKDLSELIYSKKIHYLIDLAGYSTGNRLQVFKNKPAPVQLSWLGYCNYTYIDEIDYMVTDDNVIQKNFNLHNKIIKMPNIWNAMSKLDDIDVNELPCLKNKIFNFGCFNNFLKISDETIEVWGEILNKFTNSNLILKNSVSMDRNYKKYFIKRFKNKIDENRIFLLNYEKDKKKHLQQYHNIDLCLDTFPYNGVTTTFESLWMGVPVITLKGKRFISRCGYSINKNANLNEFITQNKNEYISSALKYMLDTNIKKLTLLRKNLRSKLLKTTLFDTIKFTDNFIDQINNVS
tara:strand:+ start:688 stop:2313 length:1626 start_codon:yes stop_codon:yes gene_type:complete